MAGLTSSLMMTAALSSQLMSVLTVPQAPSVAPNVHEASLEQMYQAPKEDRRIVDVIQASQSSEVNLGRDITGILSAVEGSIHGVDISSHQHVDATGVDAGRTVQSGMSFAFVKATEGTGYINPFFRADVVDYMTTGVPVGFYHYALPSASAEDAREQARLFVRVTGINKGVTTLPPVLDIEEARGLSPVQLQDWARAFIDEMRRLTGRDTMIYTYQSFWRNEMANTTEFSYLPLWIADYNNKSEPSALPGGWDHWTFWQYSSKGSTPGIVGDVDVNEFNGTSEQLYSLYQSVVHDGDKTAEIPVVEGSNPDESVQQPSRQRRESERERETREFADKVGINVG